MRTDTAKMAGCLRGAEGYTHRRLTSHRDVLVGLTYEEVEMGSEKVWRCINEKSSRGEVS